jgi:hypothetical protein
MGAVFDEVVAPDVVRELCRELGDGVMEAAYRGG